jgi:hypothetical protein
MPTARILLFISLLIPFQILIFLLLFLILGRRLVNSPSDLTPEESPRFFRHALWLGYEC